MRIAVAAWRGRIGSARARAGPTAREIGTSATTTPKISFASRGWRCWQAALCFWFFLVGGGGGGEGGEGGVWGGLWVGVGVGQRKTKNQKKTNPPPPPHTHTPTPPCGLRHVAPVAAEEVLRPKPGRCGTLRRVPRKRRSPRVSPLGATDGQAEERGRRLAPVRLACSICCSRKANGFRRARRSRRLPIRAPNHAVSVPSAADEEIPCSPVRFAPEDAELSNLRGRRIAAKRRLGRPQPADRGW